MSELPENFTFESFEDLMTSIAEQSSTTESIPDLDMDLDFDISDFPADLSDIPTGGINFSTPSIDLSVSSDSDFKNFNSDTGLFDSGLGFNSFGSSNMNQFAQPPMPQQYMPMYAPQYPYPPFGYQPPPGFMLVPAPVFYGQQPTVPMMQPAMQMPIQNPSFSFAPATDAPSLPSLDDFSFDEPEPMSAVSAPTPIRKSRRTAGKKSTYKDHSTPVAKCQKAPRSKSERPAFELNAPLSALTDGSDIPLKDMLAVATRSVAVRHAEAQKAGKTLRSLNSFVCYRSAYAERIKNWAAKDCYQNVSIIAGASWKLEPESVKEFYVNCAGVDKVNHLKAFPDYKYNPKQPSLSASPDTDDDEPTPRPQKRRQLTPTISDDYMFDASPAPTLSKYNLRRRR